MKSYKIIFSPAAIKHLSQLAVYITEKAGEKTALRYIAKIEEQCRSLKIVPLRGRSRDDIYRGLRIIGFRKSVNIAFSVYADQVIIQGIFYGGQNIDILIKD